MPSAPPVRLPSAQITAHTPTGEGASRGLPTPPEDVGFTDTAALIDSADADFQNYRDKGGVKVLNKAGDTLNVIQTHVAQVQSYASPLQTVMDSDPGKAIRQTITAIVDNIPPLLKVLDDVAQVHPFIKVAVGAFRVAVELDLKRKDNDKKISILFAEMRDMMAVLVQLRQISRDQRGGDGNHTVQDRMENLVIKTRDDITDCASVCSAYSKKHTFSKVIQSSSWEDKFKGFVQVFTTRRGEFEFELSMYVGRVVNTANDRLVTIDEKLDRLAHFFEACVTPEERRLTELVKANGGVQAVISDKATLRKLYEDKGLAPLLVRTADRRTKGPAHLKELKGLQEDLKVDTETAIRRNFKQFERMYAIQKRELEEELRRSMHREGDRIIQSVTSGPHDKIVDPDIHEIWKEMTWRGNVKGRYFVLALRDYFREHFDKIKRRKSNATPMVKSTRHISEEDEWALEYINVTRLQPIIEAFDDDASGFITVAEVNAFTKARPDNWSLLHWLAYLAVGHQMAMSEYAEKIDIILAKMFSLKALVLPANRNSIEQYLNAVWTLVASLTEAFRRIAKDESLMGKFESYVKSEEARLQRNLEDARYDFDARDAVDIVRGPGTIEKHVLPLLYLLLARHFEIMRLALTRVLNVDEMYDAYTTIAWVMKSIDDRCRDLKDLFIQLNLDPGQQFKIFGYEIFRFRHDENEFTSLKRLKEANFLEVEYNDGVEAQDVDPTTILNHPMQSDLEELFAKRVFVETEADARADPHVRAIIGHWSGFYYGNNLFPIDEMLSLDIHASSSDAKQFQAAGIATNGSNWVLSGEYKVDESGKVTYALTITYKALVTENLRGQLSSNCTMLSGTFAWGDNPQSFPNNFVLKRLSAEAMKYWPSPAEWTANKNRALWKFACNAVRDDVSRRLHSWTYLQQRWNTGKEYVRLRHKMDMSPLSAEEERALSECYRRNTPEEARLYQIFLDLRRRSVPDHFIVGCDACDSQIRGGRVMCLSCGIKFTVDLCDKPECCAAVIGTDARDDLATPHLPSHDMFKVRTAIHPIREFGPAHEAAMKALKVARKILEDAIQPEEESSEANAKTTTAVTEQPQKRPICAKCGGVVSQPCWYCIECRDPNAESCAGIFICDACDTKYGGFAANEHKAWHGLVKVQVQSSADVATSERAFFDACMNALEGNLKEMQHNLDQSLVSVDEKVEFVKAKLGLKMDERLSAMDSRLQRIEDLLLALALGRSVDASSASVSPAATGSQRAIASLTMGGSLDSESEFSSWVRQLRNSS
ncbi:hypothetical protein L226DRAFT_314748 [Lentinus tigrinus ALCF2SS1-7]|uniref:EF-hand domain-containing protein n=1 Tax=Lentinus tigrinus ALCF2SS1-6 TaxID=1328759 RepID=A0A5C2S7N8_9APHY|nr:hypothetical protein L227DRAFT_576174 [Lentinus tigrinus ALCF2SS1-6]RPD68741.1 hypothetical protein L226DRAFT_314748 [Lentinus tigrinus ALCF2SS1-7]